MMKRDSAIIYESKGTSKNRPEIDSLFVRFGRKKFISLKTTGHTSILILNFV